MLSTSDYSCGMILLLLKFIGEGITYVIPYNTTIMDGWMDESREKGQMEGNRHRIHSAFRLVLSLTFNAILSTLLP